MNYKDFYHSKRSLGRTSGTVFFTFLILFCSIKYSEVFPRNNVKEYDVNREEIWLTAPTGNKFQVIIFTPQNDKKFPALVCLPGGLGAGTRIGGNPFGFEIIDVARMGFVTAGYFPEGRGPSEGEEDYNGFIHQDNMKQVIEYVAGLPNVDRSNIGVLTASYGLTASAGCMARYPKLPVKYVVDLEGPTYKDHMIPPSRREEMATFFGHELDDDDFWKERGAVQFIDKIKCRYLRIQGLPDHAQGEYLGHAVMVLNKATEGGVWNRVNDNPPNQTYTETSLKQARLLQGMWKASPKNIERIMDFIVEMSQMPPISASGSSLPQQTDDPREYIWSEPINVEIVNTPYGEKGPCISPDGKILYFTRNNYPENYGRGFNIWYSEWNGSWWGAPEKLSRIVNEGEAGDCSITSDGKTMYFQSSRPGGYGAQDIWYTEWDGKDWTKPKNAGPNINSPGFEWTPAISPDGNTLYFLVRSRPGNIGFEDLWVSRKKDGDWQQAENCGAVINTKANEVCPWVTADGRALYFARMINEGGAENPSSTQELGRITEHFLWVSLIRNGKLQQPVKLKGGINVPGMDACCPTLTPDGKTIYFTSNRTGTKGRFDIWMSYVIE